MHKYSKNTYIYITQKYIFIIDVGYDSSGDTRQDIVE